MNSDDKGFELFDEPNVGNAVTQNEVNKIVLEPQKASEIKNDNGFEISDSENVDISLNVTENKVEEQEQSQIEPIAETAKTPNNGEAGKMEAVSKEPEVAPTNDSTSEKKPIAEETVAPINEKINEQSNPTANSSATIDTNSQVSEQKTEASETTSQADKPTEPTEPKKMTEQRPMATAELDLNDINNTLAEEEKKEEEKKAALSQRVHNRKITGRGSPIVPVFLHPDEISVHDVPGDLTLGAYLKALRDANGLTYDRLYQATGISPRYLKALEEDNYENFHGLSYALAYVGKLSDIYLPPKDKMRNYTDPIRQNMVAEVSPNTKVISRTDGKAMKDETIKLVLMFASAIVLITVVVAVIFVLFWAGLKRVKDEEKSNFRAASTIELLPQPKLEKQKLQIPAPQTVEPKIKSNFRRGR